MSRSIFTCRLLVIGSFIFFSTAFESARSQNVSGSIEAQAGFTTNNVVPFWMRSNTYGSVPLPGPSTSLIAAFERQYDTTKTRFIDWGLGFEGRGNFGREVNATLIEGYGKIKLGPFELKGGRMKETFGLTDTLLTTGNFAISGNALGVPKVQLAIPEFYALPFFGKLFAVKGLYAQGWLGEQPIQNKRVDKATTYFHQKALYLRIGKPEWRVRFYGGMNDQVFYGSEGQIFESFVMTDWQKYQSVVLGRNWANSKVGNHVGNLDVRIEYKFDRVLLGLYRQSFYEAGALYHLANIADGINGIFLQNRDTDQAGPLRWRKLVFEYIYSKNQAGETWSKPTPTGDENYLNHYLYAKGWSYEGLGLGTPLITPASDARTGLPFQSKNYFINNRVAAVHLGAVFDLVSWDILSKVTYSKNFGVHGTSPTFGYLNQFSAIIVAKKHLANGFQVGATGGFDTGGLLYNAQALMLHVVKHFR